MRINLTASLLAVGSVIAVTNPAQAATFEFDSAVGGNSNVGVHKQIKTSFNSDTEELSWSSTFSRNLNNGTLADGAWLVLNDGPNPKSHVQENTMFYFDGVNEKLTAYTYNGVNGSNSWQDNNSVYLGSWDLDVDRSADEVTFSFDMDMTDINSRTDLGNDWQGTLFNDQIGIWFHGVSNVQAAYNADGSLSNFSYDSQGWFDAANLQATKVPEPGALAGLAMVGLVAAKTLRRKSA